MKQLLYNIKEEWKKMDKVPLIMVSFWFIIIIIAFLGHLMMID